MKTYPSRTDALALLQKYNQDPFHLRHAITLEAVMQYFAEEQGFGDEKEFWGIVGLLHDVDFEVYPDTHLAEAPHILGEINASDELIHAVCSHGYGICTEVKPTHQMEKILFAVDELTGLIYAAALMRPSKSTQDMELKSVKKKYKDKKFAAGCSRDIISRGAEDLGWELSVLLEKTLKAMQATEDRIEENLAQL